MDNYNYPMGADTSDAPWNRSDKPSVEIEVTISVTLSRTAKVRVNDYGLDSSGTQRDFSECDLKEAVKKQIRLPQEEFDNWNEDEFEVICEE